MIKSKILDFKTIFPLERTNLLTLDIILILITAFIILAIVAFVLASVIRRILRARRFRQLDKLRRYYQEKLKDIIYSGRIGDEAIKQLSFPPGSLKFQAMEDVLFKLMEKKKYEPEIRELFKRLGYVEYYENKLRKRNRLIKAIALDKLGRMKSTASIEKIAGVLRSNDPEIINVAIKALANIGTSQSLETILDHLPLIYEKWLITRKAAENAILKYGQEVVPLLLDYLTRTDNPKIIAIVLDILSHLKNEKAWPVALNYLAHENPEVRGKSLKVLEAFAHMLDLGETEKIISLLRDPVWFVRLYALRVLQQIRSNKIQYALASSLFDNHWQVRDEAAKALARLGSSSLDIFLEALLYDDHYVQETICDEIEKTGFVNQLLENLRAENGEEYKKSKEILVKMHALNFSTPLLEYLKDGSDEKIKEEIKAILESGSLK